MYCKNCGNEIENGNKFCTQCGTPVEGQPAAAASVNPMELLQTAAAKVAPLKDKAVAAAQTAVKTAGPALQSGLRWLSDNSATVIPLAKAAAFAAMIFFWFSEVLTLSVLGMTREFSMLDMSEGAEWVSYLTAVILAAGAVCSVFPGISPKWNIPMIASGWTAFWFIASVLTAADQMGGYSSYDPEIELTFTGWLLGILSVGMLVLTVLDLLKRKRAAATAHPAKNYGMQSANTRTCPNCHEQVNGDIRFCSACGSSMDNISE